MAIQIQGYQQSRQPGSPADAPTLSAPQLPNAGREIQRFAQAGMEAVAAVHSDQAEAEALNAYSQLRQQTEELFVNARETAQPGADKFTPETMKAYRTRVEAMASDMEPGAKNRFARRALALEDNLFERSLAFEAGERQRYRIETFERSADAGANTLFTTDGQERAKAYTELETDILGALVGMELEPGASRSLPGKSARSCPTQPCKAICGTGPSASRIGRSVRMAAGIIRSCAASKAAGAISRRKDHPHSGLTSSRKAPGRI